MSDANPNSEQIESNDNTNGEGTRLSQWKEPKELGFGVIGDSENAKAILEISKKLNSNTTKEKSKGPTINDLIKPCRELIYDERDGKIIFHAISHYINPDKMIIEAGQLFEISSSGDDQTDEEEAIDMLAIAAMEEVPVFPNRPEFLPRLTELHRRLLTDGFTAPDGKGNRVRLKFAKRPTIEFLEVGRLGEIDCSVTIFPAEIALIRDVALREIARLTRAESVLSALDRGIAELEAEIALEERNENAIQRCITRNPILFGVEYIKILPKHKLGSEYEMDYAGKRFDGSYDLIELESSNLTIYTKGGNPSSHLVHAEQQVLDWLAWVEENFSYASQSLNGISNPVGFVIIGRRDSLSAESAEKLRRRNIYWGGRISILTYEDLLERAESIKSRLTADLHDNDTID
ncbi:MAG TPA: Shedu anti-phage system protein SduA domain-containing protein [Sphingopyxis sp.]|uniref:Shedu anti-phage system protein SduA domain-containing protein n=1 Tax=Sphingopyxis sp. TaxID=1908224 RepID=UPI002BF14AD4|nr:Shedu anti-phage system protein SduA domain-containing protein [Sphingopyxis sp.]HWW59508.1 Shedu anti-phage system protein SduA domain-containing protein [Sphingopyxis sp.]